MSETIKVCVRQSYDAVKSAIASPILERLLVNPGQRAKSVKFVITVDYHIDAENPYGDFCMLTITD